MKVAVMGGGSSYTPELVKGFLDRADSFPLEELWLVDIAQERLDVVGGRAAGPRGGVVLVRPEAHAARGPEDAEGGRDRSDVARVREAPDLDTRLAIWRDAGAPADPVRAMAPRLRHGAGVALRDEPTVVGESNSDNADGPGARDVDLGRRRGYTAEHHHNEFRRPAQRCRPYPCPTSIMATVHERMGRRTMGRYAIGQQQLWTDAVFDVGCHVQDDGRHAGVDRIVFRRRFVRTPLVVPRVVIPVRRRPEP